MNLLNKQKVCLAFDVSGSLTGMFDSLNNTREFDKIINSIRSKIKNVEIHLVTFDTKIQNIHILNDNDFLYQLKMEKVVQGGGGTDPNCLANYIKENNCSELHMITDGYMCLEKDDFNIDIFAYLTGKNSTIIEGIWNKVIPFEDLCEKKDQSSNYQENNKTH